MAVPYKLSFCSLNVQGLNQARKRRQIYRWLHNYNFDIIFLQETYSSKNTEDVWKAEWGGKIYFSHGTTHSKGVMILFNPKLNFEINSATTDKNGRYLLLKTKMFEEFFLLCNVYAPNDSNSQEHFLSNLGGILQQYADLNLIIGGDFNCPITSADKAGGSSVLKKKKVIDEVNSLCQGFQLQDIWRSQQPNQTQYTWRNKSFKIQCRFDYWLVSRDLSSLVIKSDIIHATISDHSAITFNLQSKEYAKRGQGFGNLTIPCLKITLLLKILLKRFLNSKISTLILPIRACIGTC